MNSFVQTQKQLCFHTIYKKKWLSVTKISDTIVVERNNDSSILNHTRNPHVISFYIFTCSYHQCFRHNTIHSFLFIKSKKERGKRWTSVDSFVKLIGKDLCAHKYFYLLLSIRLLYLLFYFLSCYSS